jgi:hypothetical protein
MPRTIHPDGHTIHDDGYVQRHDVPPPYGRPSGQWRITGAVTLNNFGYVTRRYTLAEVLADPSAIPWKFRNGKQRTFLTDIDHGTHRVRMSPDHSVS